jgi:hypothetical protein
MTNACEKKKKKWPERALIIFFFIFSQKQGIVIYSQVCTNLKLVNYHLLYITMIM